MIRQGDDDSKTDTDKGADRTQSVQQQPVSHSSTSPLVPDAPAPPPPPLTRSSASRILTTGMGTAFVTVGTTSHPRLVRHLSGLPVLRVRSRHCPDHAPPHARTSLQELAAQGIERLVVQVGGSPVPEQLVPNADSVGIRVEVFSYKESIAQEIRAAELVISHAGMKCRRIKKW